jgi:hypothetical protein
MSPDHVPDDREAERARRQRLRRKLLVRYFSNVFSEEEIPDHAVEEAFTTRGPFRAWVARQGINPATLAPCTEHGRRLLRELANE